MVTELLHRCVRSMWWVAEISQERFCHLETGCQRFAVNISDLSIEQLEYVLAVARTSQNFQVGKMRLNGVDGSQRAVDIINANGNHSSVRSAGGFEQINARGIPIINFI